MAKKIAAQLTDDDDALLAALGIDPEPTKQASKTPREERIIAGFEAIQRFVVKHGHAPKHSEENDIFERLYAVRLDCIRTSDECQQLLSDLDDFAPSAYERNIDSYSLLTFNSGAFLLFKESSSLPSFSNNIKSGIIC